MNHTELTKQFGQGREVSPEQVNRLSKVKAKVEVIGDDADLQRVRDLLKELAQS